MEWDKNLTDYYNGQLLVLQLLENNFVLTKTEL